MSPVSDHTHNPSAPSSAAANSAACCAPARWWAACRRHWPALLILALALALRLIDLGGKPPHFDEGVNGALIDGMTRDGFYHYDPGNFHGPLHFYALFVAQTLFGRHIWALRLPIALLSAGCVGLMLLHGRTLGKSTASWAALVMAISPGMVFYGRYAIHETWLLFFLLLISWGALGLWREGQRRHLWAVVMGICGMMLTKETYVIHLLAMLLSWPTLLALNRFSPSAPLPFAKPQWQSGDLCAAIATALGLLLFFYSGGFLDFSSLPGLWQTFAHWFSTGTGGASGHEKPWHYWFTLLARYEWPALLGLAATPWILWPQRPGGIRVLTIYGLGTLCAYSIVSYKTPWCLIVLMWPLHLLCGVAIDRAARQLDRWVTAAVAFIVMGASLFACVRLNFYEATNEDEPYVYVQTLPEVMHDFIDPLTAIARQDPGFYQLRGTIMTTEHFPLSWLLGDFPNVNYLDIDKPIDGIETADFILIDLSLSESLEAKLDGEFFKDSFRLRGYSPDTAVLYLRAQSFRRAFPQRPVDLSLTREVADDTESDLGKLP